jgi:hypothetical protein
MKIITKRDGGNMKTKCTNQKQASVIYRLPDSHRKRTPPTIMSALRESAKIMCSLSGSSDDIANVRIGEIKHLPMTCRQCIGHFR